MIRLSAALWLLATPALAATPDVGAFWWRWLGAVVLCLLLAVAGAYALRLRGGAAARPLSIGGFGQLLAGALVRRPARGTRLGLVEAIRINPQLEVCLVRCDGREYLLAATPQTATLLDDDLMRTRGA